MGRYRPNMIDGIAGLALGGEASEGAGAPPARAARALTAAGLAGQEVRRGGAGRAPPLISEPEPATATIEDWIAYRHRVGPLAGRDPGMRLALAVAEAQIAKLRRRMRARQDTRQEDGAEN